MGYKTCVNKNWNVSLKWSRLQNLAVAVKMSGSLQNLHNELRKKECALAHSRACGGRLRHLPYTPQCASSLPSIWLFISTRPGGSLLLPVLPVFSSWPGASQIYFFRETLRYWCWFHKICNFLIRTLICYQPVKSSFFYNRKQLIYKLKCILFPVT